LPEGQTRMTNGNWPHPSSKATLNLLHLTS